MSVAEEIRAAVAPFGYPCAQNEYIGQAQVYFVFNLQTIPVNYADDDPQNEKILIQLHLFAPPAFNTTDLKNEIKLAIQGAGFLYPSMEDASDRNNQHVVFETQGVKEVGTG